MSRAALELSAMLLAASPAAVRVEQTSSV
jgi:hypothetical protein